MDCPKCNSEMLHQFVVIVHNRSREDGPSQPFVILNGHGNANPNPAFAAPPNPSPRRQGVSIGFWCEECPEISWVHYGQHKGTTTREVE